MYKAYIYDAFFYQLYFLLFRVTAILTLFISLKMKKKNYLLQMMKIRK